MSNSGKPRAIPAELEARLLDAVRRGPSMEDIAHLRDPNINTPEEAIQELKRGNERFFGGAVSRPEISAFERRAQIITQTPFAVVLGCSDSRVPIEIVYDQGLGDLFIVRVAGQIVDSATLGSIEYAITHLKCHLVVVMGHEGCGAVKAALMSDQQIAAEPQHIQYLIGRIRPAVRALPRIRDEKARMREAVVSHIRHQVHQLRQNQVVQAAVAQSQIAVIGAFYEIGSGAVDFFVTEEELAIDPPEQAAQT
jgi:carbonic anhydrase